MKFKGKLTIVSVCGESTEHSLCLVKKICSHNGCRRGRCLVIIADRFDIITLSALKHNTVDLGRIRAKYLKKNSTKYHILQDNAFYNEMIDLCPIFCQPILRKIMKIEFNKFDTIDASLLNIWSLRAGYKLAKHRISSNANKIQLIDLREQPNVANIIHFQRGKNNHLSTTRTRKELLNKLVEQEIATSQVSYSEIDKELMDNFE